MASVSLCSVCIVVDVGFLSEGLGAVRRRKQLPLRATLCLSFSRVFPKADLR